MELIQVNEEKSSYMVATGTRKSLKASATSNQQEFEAKAKDLFDDDCAEEGSEPDKEPEEIPQ